MTPREWVRRWGWVLVLVLASMGAAFAGTVHLAQLPVSLPLTPEQEQAWSLEANVKPATPPTFLLPLASATGFCSPLSGAPTPTADSSTASAAGSRRSARR